MPNISNNDRVDIYASLVDAGISDPSVIISQIMDGSVSPALCLYIFLKLVNTAKQNKTHLL